MTDQPRSPCGSKNKYVLNCDGRKKSNGASHFTTLISFRGWRVVSLAGVFTRAYLRNAATGRTYERALLIHVPGVLRVIAAAQHASLSTLLVCLMTDFIRLDNQPI